MIISACLMLAALLDGAANLPDDNLPLDLPESFSGQIVIGHRDGILVQASRGLADRAGQVPVTPETLFDMGSLTKQITAAGVVLLAGEGRLSLQEPLSAFFETLPRDIAGRTVHDLLVHTAGLPQYSGGDYDPVDRSAFSAWLATADTSEVAPGTFHYSNPGYSMAARIIEMRSGEDFELFVQTRLLAPAGIGDIGYRNLPDDRVEAIGYRGGEAQGRPSEQPWLEDGPSWNLRGNGGLLTTADALYRWTLALTGGGVLDEAHRPCCSRRIRSGTPSGAYHTAMAGMCSGRARHAVSIIPGAIWFSSPMSSGSRSLIASSLSPAMPSTN